MKEKEIDMAYQFHPKRYNLNSNQKSPGHPGLSLLKAQLV
jgi:hypothetical protein